jgi:(p)ppGpp synthase/HD superfamily hydrolase
MNLDKAIIIATNAHSGQLDKGGNPYILHPLRLMLSMSSEESRIVAMLHDVVEDSNISFDNLKDEGFSDEIIEAIKHLTRRDDETYVEFIRRIKKNDLARLVKMADIDDNKDLSRIKNPTEKDIERVKKYNKALNELLF